MIKRRLLITCITLVSLVLLSQCQAQEVRSNRSHPYNRKDVRFHSVLKGMQFDSVKVFRINCNKIDYEGPGVLLDTSMLYYKLNSSSLNISKMVVVEDIKDLLYVLKRSHRDVYRDDPVSPYVPSIGVVFYSAHKVCAHIEVSLETGKMELEVINADHSTYQKSWAVLGENMRLYFKDIKEKYNLHCP